MENPAGATLAPLPVPGHLFAMWAGLPAGNPLAAAMEHHYARHAGALAVCASPDCIQNRRAWAAAMAESLGRR